MKRVLLFLSVLLLFPLVVRSQTQSFVDIAPVSVDIMGRSISADYSIYKKRHAFNVGVSYLLNPREHERYNSAMFVHKAYATNVLQRFSIKLGYKRFFKFKDGNVIVYPFSEIRVAYTGLKVESYILGSSIPDGNLVRVYNFVPDNLNAFWVVNHTGVGAQIKLLKKVYLNQQVGICPTYTTEIYTNPFDNKKRIESGIEGFTVPFYNIGLAIEI